MNTITGSAFDFLCEKQIESGVHHHNHGFSLVITW